jgi:hypothetical protein
VVVLKQRLTDKLITQHSTPRIQYSNTHASKTGATSGGAPGFLFVYSLKLQEPSDCIDMLCAVPVKDT